MDIIEGDYFLKNTYKIAIIVARFNSFVTDSLLNGALETYKKYGIESNRINIIKVPGAFEIPLIAKKIAQDYDLILALGAVIKGESSHFDYVAGQCASGIMNTMLDTLTPIIFGILTTDNNDQAIDRSGIKLGNKGSEGAISSIEVLSLLEKLN